MKAKVYKSATSFRTSLEERVKTIAVTEGIDLQRLRKQVSFDRFLARAFSNHKTEWILKGGYALQLRTDHSRATKDVDLALKELRIQSSDEKERALALLELVQDCGTIDLNDFFTFIVSGPIMDLDAPPYGGARFLVESRIDNRTFEKFHLDVGIGDAWIEPVDELKPRGWLEFADIKTKVFPVVSSEQHFAEKIHAYTLPRAEGVMNSRVKDLVDMALFMSINELEPLKLVSAIQLTFKRRATHEFSKNISPPPADWEPRFKAMAKECDLDTNIHNAFEALQKFLSKLPF